jgi:parallel beta-helix repeat protein
MKNFTNISKFAAQAAIAAIALAGCKEQEKGKIIISMAPKTVSVSNARQFLEALGSNRIIEMMPGRYNLSEWAPCECDDDRRLQLSEGVSWSGGGIVLRNINNLVIRGARDGGISEIVIESLWAEIMSFYNSSNISIENITAGHTERPGICDGGVLYFEESSQISITGVNMYGSGTRGLTLVKVHGMRVADSQIYECTADIMLLNFSSNISFENCLFRDNGGGINSYQSENVTFSKCKFRNNPYYDNPGMRFENCVFE